MSAVGSTPDTDSGLINQALEGFAMNIGMGVMNDMTKQSAEIKKAIDEGNGG